MSSKSPNKCSFCGRVFLLKSSLRIHETEHKEKQKNDEDSSEEEEKPITLISIGKNDSRETIVEKAPDDNRQEKRYICKECGKCFFFKSILESHLLDHKRKPSKPKLELFCPICNKRFTKRKILTQHVRRHKKREQFRCSICDKGFLTQEIVDKHVIKRHSNPKTKTKRPTKKLKMILKDENESNQESCTSNVDSKNDSETPPKSHTCYLCNEIFPMRTEFLKHCKMHEKELYCHKCNKSFSDYERLKRHARRHKPPVQCEICGKLVSIPKYPVHLRMHRGEKRYKCQECGACFVQSAHLKRHKITHLPKEDKQLYYQSIRKDYLCDLCGKIFKSKQGMRNHNELHCKDEDTPAKKHLICSVCSDEFSTIANLNKHKMYRHPEVVPSCQICTQKFTYNHLLYSHYLKHSKEELETLDQELQHKIFKSRLEENDKPHKCTYCDKSFRLKPNLTAHLRTHTGERPYSCSVCFKTFVQQVHLKSHFARHHSGKKPYVCNICGKSFAVQNYLYNHAKTHSMKMVTSIGGKRMFSGKDFANKHSQINHQKSCLSTAVQHSSSEVETFEINIGDVLVQGRI